MRFFSKLLVLATVVLIFAGGHVKSTNSGLSVPDWPLSYGMVFPPMVGGVFYEHGHRLIATCVGLLTVCLAVWIFLKERRRWVKFLAGFAILAVVVQGLLGGLTVLLMLPPSVSVAHGVTGQTFLCIVVFMAYSLSQERTEREAQVEHRDRTLARAALMLAAAVYVQLILGAIMRHLNAGLAVYDFPTFAGSWLPSVSDATLARINVWAMAHDQPLVEARHVMAHLAHRFWALIVVGLTVGLNFKAKRCGNTDSLIRKSLMMVNVAVVVQFSLGVLTIWTEKSPYVASLHVVMGAVLLGLCVLLSLRTMPLQWRELNSPC